MRSLVLIGLFVLVLSSVSAREKRGEKRYRKFGPPKDKRGSEYPSPHQTIGGYSPGLFQPINGLMSGHSFSGLPASYAHQEQLSASHSTPFVPLTFPSSEKSGLNSMTLSLSKPSGLPFFSLPASSPMLSPAQKTGPITFAVPSGSSSGKNYINPLYATGMQGLSAYSSGASHGLTLPLVNMAAYGYPHYSTAAHGISSSPGSHYSSPDTSHTVSAGLVFAESPQGSSSSYSSASSPTSSSTYHVGLSSGSSDSSSYHLPISSAESPASTSYTKYQPPVSSAGSSYISQNTQAYSLPSTSYGSPSNVYSSSSSSSSPTVHYVPTGSTHLSSNYNSVASSNTNPSVSYSPSNLYSGSSEYTRASQVSSSYATPDHQASYTNISPVYVSQISGRNYNEEPQYPKYDTISYSSPTGKY